MNKKTIAVKNFFNNPELGAFILRVGLAAVMLWFGFSQALAPETWAGFVPGWATDFLPALAIVRINSVFEIIAGVMLLLGLSVRPVAFLLFLHLVVIAGSFGLSAVGVRDFGLSAALLALTFLGPDRYALFCPRTVQL